MTKPNGNADKASLDARTASALIDADAPKDALTALVAEAETAIVAAKQTIAVESERELDLSNIDPDKSGDLVRKAQRTIVRLQRAIPLLEKRIQQIAKREYAEAWHARADQIESERDALAQELTGLYVPFLKKIADVYARIDKCDARISQINGAAPPGESRRVLGAELKARKLNSFSADQPPLREHLRLPDPGYTKEICFPPPAPIDQLYGAMHGAAAALAQKHAAAYGPDWHEAKKLQDQQTREEIAKREDELAEQRRQSERNFHDALRREDAARGWPLAEKENEQ